MPSILTLSQAQPNTQLTDAANFQQGTIFFNVKTLTNTPLVQVTGKHASISIAIERHHLVYRCTSATQNATIECEDIHNLTDDQWHSLAVSVDQYGTRIYIDGYQECCATATTFIADCDADYNADCDTQHEADCDTQHEANYDAGYTHGHSADSNTICTIQLADSAFATLDAISVTNQACTDETIKAKSLEPAPTIEFAAQHLSQHDTQLLRNMRSGSLYISFRVRGRGQAGTIFAIGGERQDYMSLSIDAHGITFAHTWSNQEHMSITAEGSWDEGNWHDLVLTAAQGALEMYIDGYRVIHEPGQVFFAQLPDFTTVSLGQNCTGVRLLGEARYGAIFEHPLNDSQIKHLSDIAPIHTIALFDRGYQHSNSYRIPSLIALPSGVLIAGADQRMHIPNDAPNEINFAIRRSLDAGAHWEPLQTICTCKGTGLQASSYTDSVLTYDEQSQQVIAVVDHFPGGIGQPNSSHGVGYTSDGLQIVVDADGKSYHIQQDGSVTTENGLRTPYHVDSDGNITEQMHAQETQQHSCGNIWYSPQESPLQPFYALPTCSLEVLHSDDEGKTWSKPQPINHMVREPWMAFIGTAPGNGIQLRHGKHQGRIIVPVYFSGKHVMRFSTAVIYSDDHGHTWHRSSSPNDQRPWHNTTLDPADFEDEEAALYECTVAEREDGSLIFFMRNQHSSGKVAYSVSYDGGETWDCPKFHKQLPEIFSQPNAIALPDKAHPNRIAFANASQLLPYRGAGIIRLSNDGGETFPISQTLRPFHYVYQCMCPLPDNGIGIVWEHEWQGLFFTKIPLSWFENLQQ